MLVLQLPILPSIAIIGILLFEWLLPRARRPRLQETRDACVRFLYDINNKHHTNLWNLCTLRRPSRLPNLSPENNQNTVNTTVVNGFLSVPLGYQGRAPAWTALSRITRWVVFRVVETLGFMTALACMTCRENVREEKLTQPWRS